MRNDNANTEAMQFGGAVIEIKFQVARQAVRTAETGLGGDANEPVGEAISRSRFVNMRIGIASCIILRLLGNGIHRAGEDEQDCRFQDETKARKLR